MKKLFLGFMALTVTLLSACGSIGNLGLQFSTNEDVLTFQALIAAELLPNTEPVAATQTSLDTMSMSTDPEAEPNNADDVITDIEPYVELIEKVLGTNDGLNVTVDVSNLEGYESMINFSFNGLLGETETYVIHYNLVLKSDSSDDVESEDDDDDDETEFNLDGILIVGENTYTIIGKREVEDGEDKIEFIAKLDDLNYIESEYEIESDETKFEIKTVTDGILISETEIKIEQDSNETKIELEFLTNGNEGKYEFKYETEDGKPVLKVEFETNINQVISRGEIKLLILTDELTGETYYQAYVDLDDDDTYETEIDRDIDDDDDEEDDDDEHDDDEEDEVDDDLSNI